MEKKRGLVQNRETPWKKRGIWFRVGKFHEKSGICAEQGNSMGKAGFSAGQSELPCQEKVSSTRQTVPSKAVPLAWHGRALPLSRLQLCHIT